MAPLGAPIECAYLFLTAADWARSAQQLHQAHFGVTYSADAFRSGKGINWREMNIEKNKVMGKPYESSQL